MLEYSEHSGDSRNTANRHTAVVISDRLLYSVEEAADLLGIGRTFMYHLVATGEVDSLKIGKRRKIPRDSLNSYVERLRSEQL
jgi:excisionase family DNA binding protein